MDTYFDIFKRLRNGKPLWITTVPGIEEARVRVNRLGVVAPGEYLIYSQRKGVIVEYVTASAANSAPRLRRLLHPAPLRSAVTA
jgi:hypothetical protein